MCRAWRSFISSSVSPRTIILWILWNQSTYLTIHDLHPRSSNRQYFFSDITSKVVYRGCAVVRGLWATHSLPGKPGTGVLWVSTRTHPCDASTQAGWKRHQSASSCVRACGRVLHCAGRVCGRWFCCVVLSDFRTPPRTTSLALSFDLGQPRDSTFPIHSSELVKSASSSSFSLCEVLGRINGRLIDRLATFTRFPSYRTFHSCFRVRESADSSASSVDNSSCDVMSHWSAMKSLLTPSETCLSISPIPPFTLLDDSLSMMMTSCAFPFLVTSMYFSGTGDDSSVGTYSLTLDSPWWR